MRPLDASTLQAVFEHAQAEYPRECCGYLCLDETKGWQCLPCKNQQDRLHALDPKQYPRDATTAYHLGGGDLLKLVRSLESEAPARIIYHSHPTGGAYFSSTDTRAALAAGYPVDYLVVDVQEGVARHAKLFRRRDDSFVQIEQFDAAAAP